MNVEENLTVTSMMIVVSIVTVTLIVIVIVSTAIALKTVTLMIADSIGAIVVGGVEDVAAVVDLEDAAVLVV